MGAARTGVSCSHRALGRPMVDNTVVARKMLDAIVVATAFASSDIAWFLLTSDRGPCAECVPGSAARNGS
ncbi:hypothetical protein [Streptomyces sp. NBC_00576]|uniref:hypothetical protein n=1 Tax=Streptomyces sp. NBC_00576 TaxID=2903665 RepID=UPI002E807A26|nr:hypothetical protein [Streptomyces sp. NBC_00576]WUB68747.1 hypothetical protein OG734_00725 [Streptomyces sp. NBC_00576]